MAMVHEPAALVPDVADYPAGQILLLDSGIPGVREARDELEAYGCDVILQPAGAPLDLSGRQPFAIVVGPGLPPVRAGDLCRQIRQSSEAPIVVFLEEPFGDHLSMVLDAGADQCFARTRGGTARLILSAVNAVRRREEQAAEQRSEVIEAGHLRIDLERRLVTLAGDPLPLTATEYGILTLLMQRAGQLLSADEILRTVNGQSYEPAEARDIVKVHMSRLRQKLEGDPVAARCIVNVRGRGYKYVFERRGADHEATLPRLSIL